MTTSQRNGLVLPPGSGTCLAPAIVGETLILSARLVDFLLRFRERAKENEAQSTKAAPGPSRGTVGSHQELDAEALTRLGEQAIPS